jgi:hypothetical protein
MEHEGGRKRIPAGRDIDGHNCLRQEAMKFGGNANVKDRRSCAV